MHFIMPVSIDEAECALSKQNKPVSLLGETEVEVTGRDPAGKTSFFTITWFWTWKSYYRSTKVMLQGKFSSVSDYQTEVDIQFRIGAGAFLEIGLIILIFGCAAVNMSEIRIVMLIFGCIYTLQFAWDYYQLYRTIRSLREQSSS